MVLLHKTSRVALIGALLLWSGFSAAGARGDVCDEPNDQPSSACLLAPDQPVQGHIESFPDIDMYALEVPTGVNLRVDLDPPGDYRISLRRADGTVLIAPQGDGVAPRQLRYLRANGGTYYVVINSYAGDSSAELPYTLSYSLEPDGAGQPQAIAAPIPGLIEARPLDLVLRLGEVGREAERQLAGESTDASGVWYEVRYERPRSFRGLRSGWVTISNRVLVAGDVPSAQRVYRELANSAFPEAVEPVGPTFNPDVGPTIGEESYIVGSCMRTCAQEEPYVHVRVVFRHTNVVSALYVWGLGGNEGTTAESAAYLARLVAARLG